jgi:hypothetical protein
MPEPAVPIYDIAEGCHRFSFPDATHLEILRPQQDAMGRLWAEVVAKHGDERVFNRARLDLLDLEARLRFHAAAARVDGTIDWGARLLFALEHVRQTLQASETDGASEAPIPSPSDRVEPFPMQVLPTPLARLVTEGAAALPCPSDFLRVLMLPLPGAAIGTSRVLEVNPGWREGPRLYAAIVADPGGKKSPAFDLVATPTGRQTFVACANALYAELADPDCPDMMRGPLAKLEGYWACFALVLHLSRWACGEAQREHVDEGSVLGASALVDYFKSQARQEDQRMARVIQWMQGHGGACAVRDLLRGNVGGVQAAPGGGNPAAGAGGLGIGTAPGYAGPWRENPHTLLAPSQRVPLCCRSR